MRMRPTFLLHNRAPIPVRVRKKRGASLGKRSLSLASPRREAEPGGLLIPAHGVDRRAEGRARQHDVGHHVDDDENVDRYRQPEEVPLPEVAVPPAEARNRERNP